MEEFDQLVNSIVNSSTSLPARSFAEQRLMEMLSDRTAWKHYASLLSHANDTITFFICIGFQKLIWKHWRDISMEDKLQLNQTIVQTLQTRQNLQPFAKSKMEQVLATICANSCSLEPALGLIVEVGKPGTGVGISVMRSVLELILSEDPKLIPDYKAPLLSATQEILIPLTNLACNACTLALQVNSDENCNIMLVSLELLKIIVTKLQIGAHVTSDVINLLFTIAEMGADTANNAAFHRSALSSIEVLTEIMSKRYLPPSSSAPGGNSSSNNNNNNNNANTNRMGDTSMNMLLDIVVKSISLLKKFRTSRSLDDSDIVLNLLEFISVFAESHLERVIEMSNLHGDNTTTSSNINASSQSGNDVNLNQSVALFFEELVATSALSMDPSALHKLVSVWNRVISLGRVKETLLQQPTSICLPVVSHLLQACLLQTNSHLVDAIEEMMEDLSVITLVDPHIKAVLSHVSDRKEGKSSQFMTETGAVGGGNRSRVNSSSGGSGGGVGDADGSNSSVHRRRSISTTDDHTDVLGKEEHSYVGTTMLEDVQRFFVELIVSPEVATWLNQTISQLVLQNINTFSNTAGDTGGMAFQAAALDLLYLIRLLPIVSTNRNELIAQLVNLAVQLIESNMHTKGKAVEVLEMQCCQIAGQILQSSGPAVANPSTGPVASEELNTIQNLFVLLVRGLNCVCNVNNPSCPYSVLAAFTILFTQSVAVYSQYWNVEAMNGIKVGVEGPLLQLLDQETSLVSRHLPIEVYVLLIIAQDEIIPTSVATILVNRCLELTNILDASCVQTNQPADRTVIDDLMRITAALDALARHHSKSRPQRRQLLISFVGPLQTFMGKYASTVLRALIISYTVPPTLLSNGAAAVSSGSTIIYASKLVISLSTGLLQSLGKKTFGRMASEVLSVCVDFVENASSISLHMGSGGGGSNRNSLGLGGDSSGALTIEDITNNDGGGGGGGGNTNTSRGAGSDDVSMSSVMFQSTGVALLKQFLELSSVLAEATAATSQYANMQAMTSHRLLVFIAGGLSDEKVCAELLQPTLRAGIIAIACYWQKTHKTLPFLASISRPPQNNAIMSAIGAQAAAIGGGNSGNVSNSRGQEDPTSFPADINGENVRPIVLLITQLCVGSLSPTVPPQDALIALEGLLQLSEQHKLFSMPWFQHQCWGSLLTPCLKALLLHVHDMHRPTLEELLIALATAGEISYTDVATKAAEAINGSPRNSIDPGTFDFNSLNANAAASPAPQGSNRSNSIHHVSTPETYAKHQEFWINIGRELVQISEEFGCAEIANHTLYSVLNSHQAAALAAAQSPTTGAVSGSGFLSTTGSNNGVPPPSLISRGPVVLDMRLFIDKIVNPVSSEIARRMS